MKRALILVLCLACSLTITSLPAQPRSNGQTPPPQSKHVSSPAYSSEGERVFKQNCSRCHDAPQSFPPQISGTVIRHMRVRASLSDADEKELLKFLNP
jgi:cytochrome c5